MRTWLLRLGPLCWAVSLAAAGQTPPTHQMTVTVLDHGKPAAQTLDAGSFAIRQGNALDPITAATRADGENARLDLYILFDRDAGADILPALPLVRNFVASLPPTTRVGFGYMQNGGLQMIAEPTVPRAQAVAAIQAPAPTVSPSPFESMVPLVRQWKPEPGVRHEILAFTDGETPVDSDMGDNPLVRKLLPEYQGPAVVVYAIYVGGKGGSATTAPAAKLSPKGVGGSAGASASALDQGNLQFLTSATGGQAYFGLPLTIETIREYLDDIRVRMENQYLLTYTPAPVKKPGPENVKVALNAGGLSVIAPKAIVLP